MFTTKLILHLPKKPIFNFINRLATSALYITADKATETFSVLTPHIDFEQRLKDKNKLKENLQLRECDVNLDELITLWIFYKKFHTQKSEIERARSNIAKSLKLLSPEKDKKEIDKLITHGKMIKEDLRAIKDQFHAIEDDAITKVLSLPNIVHEKTPISEPLIIHVNNDAPKTKTNFHLNIAENLDLIEYKSSSCYYLKNDTALFELGSSFYISDQLLEKKFVEFSNSDFSRSVVVEGCGIDYYDPKQVFTIMENDLEHKHENSRLHLTGGASLPAFMAYHTKHTIFPSLLPLKYFTISRRYNPVVSNENSLLNVTQETAVDIFVATKDDTNAMNIELDKLIKNIIEIYESLNYHFRVCYLPVKDLKKWESMRVSIQMYSNHLNKYFEVGYVSVCDNYVSKRLLFNYGTGYDMSFPRILNGTIFSVPKVLSCVMENNEETKEELLHNNFKKYVS